MRALILKTTKNAKVDLVNPYVLFVDIVMDNTFFFGKSPHRDPHNRFALGERKRRPSSHPLETVP